ncbi:tetratricopeptide repeat protein (macronuclear) [Tetrahymena thermophila SB210]|uniref:Tetratricopeptide repeat protein n=1 Tax=Tetrahymena thermophila (strain SB210) TaxID=312017 RepID=I7LWX8_TETTS|nr:tetratricopeptide repeat protein [Tetrahymena thermophila SB210]EAS03055.1 tetratricopeptide repeat protein [Tetrahymena thermophila SB210]|eukprot:XP_001023300.1 tetratricopeptide repeat protein [Tetrahymena thermophila SB210]
MINNNNNNHNHNNNNQNQEKNINITNYQTNQQEIYNINLLQSQEKQTSIQFLQKEQNHFQTNSSLFDNQGQSFSQNCVTIEKGQDKILINQQDKCLQTKMNSLNQNNFQILGLVESSCSDQIDTGKEIGSDTLVPAQNQYEEDDTQICDLLLKAQEYKENQELEQAEKIYFDVLQLQKQKYGFTSYQVASTYKKLASMFQKAKDYDASLKYYNEALNICKNQGGQSHSSREATCLISMSNIFLLKENVEEAQQFVTRALHIYNTQVLEDEQMKPLLISQALRLKRKIDMHEKQKQYEERQIALSQEQTICSICLEDIQKNKRVRQLNCGHIFHIKCIAQWLSLNCKCPYCRDILPKPH